MKCIAVHFKMLLKGSFHFSAFTLLFPQKQRHNWQIASSMLQHFFFIIYVATVSTQDQRHALQKQLCVHVSASRKSRDRNTFTDTVTGRWASLCPFWWGLQCGANSSGGWKVYRVNQLKSPGHSMNVNSSRLIFPSLQDSVTNEGLYSQIFESQQPGRNFPIVSIVRNVSQMNGSSLLCQHETFSWDTLYTMRKKVLRCSNKKNRVVKTV